METTGDDLGRLLVLVPVHRIYQNISELRSADGFYGDPGLIFIFGTKGEIKT